MNLSTNDATSLLLSCSAPCGQYDDFYILVNGVLPGERATASRSDLIDCNKVLLIVATLVYTIPEPVMDSVRLNFSCRAYEINRELPVFSDIVFYCVDPSFAPTSLPAPTTSLPAPTTSYFNSALTRHPTSKHENELITSSHLASFPDLLLLPHISRRH